MSNPPRRVVSLVPSITESLFDLGLGDAVFGITDYCIYPADKLVGLPRVGGTKNPRVNDIIALKPDLIFANQEENTPATINALHAAGLQVVLNFPQTVEQALADLRQIALLFQSAEAARKVEELAAAVSATRSRQPGSGLRTFCPVWQDETSDGTRWWMTFNRHTFTHDLLALCGFANVFAGRERRYPLAADLGQQAAKETAGDTRYPRVTAEEIFALAPEVILLPSEPFAFGPQDAAKIAQLLAATPAAQNERIHLLDGSYVTWPGSRIGRAIGVLLDLSSSLNSVRDRNNSTSKVL